MSKWEQSPNNKNIFSFGFTFEENDYIRHLDGYFRKNKEGNFEQIRLVDRFGLRYDLKVDDSDKRFEGEDDEKYATRLFKKYVEKIPEEEELGVITVAEQEELEKDSKKKHNFKDIDDKENTIYSFLNNKKDPSNIIPYKPNYFFYYVGKGNVFGTKNLNKGRFYEDGTPAPKNYLGDKIFSLLKDNPAMTNKIAGHDLKLYYKRRGKKERDIAYQLFYEKYGNTMINLMKRNMTFSVECKFDKNNHPINFDIHYTDWFTNADLVKSKCAMNYNNFFYTLDGINKLKYNIVKDENNETHPFSLEDLRKYLDDNKSDKNEDGQKNKNSKNSYYREPIFNAILKKNNISYDPTTKKFEFINKKETKNPEEIGETKNPGEIGLKYLTEVDFEECAKELIQERVEETFINYIKSKQKLPRDQYFIFLNKILGEENITKFLESNNIIVENKEAEKETNSNKVDKEDKNLDTNSVQKDKNTTSKDNDVEKQNTAENKNVVNEEIPFDKEFDEDFDQEDYTKKMLAKKLNIENEDLKDYDIAELQYMVNHPEEFKQEETKAETKTKTEEPDLMEKLHSLYIKNTSFTKGILLVPVGNNEQIEFTSYEDVKNYIEKNNISGKTVEELYHNFLLSVEEMHKKEEVPSKPVEENKKEPVKEDVNNTKDIEKEIIKVENEKNTPSLMQQFFELYQKNTQATGGKLSIPVGDKKRLEFDSYKDAKKYMHKRNISGNTAEEIFNNLVEDVKATYLKKIQQENKKEDVEDKTKESTASEKSYTDSKLYKILSVIAHKLDDTIAIIDNFKNQILKGKQFDTKKVLSLIGANIKDAFNYTEIEGVEKQTTKDKEKDSIEALNDKINDLTKIINDQNGMIQKQNVMIQKQNEMITNQSDIIAKQGEITAVLYSKISLNKYDEIKTEIDEIEEKYSQNNENIPAQDDRNSDRTDF